MEGGGGGKGWRGEEEGGGGGEGGRGRGCCSCARQFVIVSVFRLARPGQCHHDYAGGCAVGWETFYPGSGFFLLRRG